MPFKKHPLERKILNPIDLEIVNEKVNDGVYRSLIEFMADILWIQHNCRIINGGKLAFEIEIIQFIL